MLSEEDQKDLLELLFVNVVYLEAVFDTPNPFVQNYGETNEEKALKVLAEKVQQLSRFIPLFKELNVEIKEDTEPTEDLSEYL